MRSKVKKATSTSRAPRSRVNISTPQAIPNDPLVETSFPGMTAPPRSSSLPSLPSSPTSSILIVEGPAAPVGTDIVTTAVVGTTTGTTATASTNAIAATTIATAFTDTITVPATTLVVASVVDDDTGTNGGTDVEELEGESVDAHKNYSPPANQLGYPEYNEEFRLSSPAHRENSGVNYARDGHGGVKEAKGNSTHAPNMGTFHGNQFKLPEHNPEVLITPMRYTMKGQVREMDHHFRRDLTIHPPMDDDKNRFNLYVEGTMNQPTFNIIFGGKGKRGIQDVDSDDDNEGGNRKAPRNGF